METPKPMSRAELCIQNCHQVGFILAHKTRPDRERVAAEQLAEAAIVIRSLIGTLKSVEQTLMVPAAEYVPAIPDAWALISAALDPLKASHHAATPREGASSAPNHPNTSTSQQPDQGGE